MEYGIKKIGQIVFCANCGRMISQTNEYQDKFCSVCGCPLKIEAIAAAENEIKTTKLSLLEDLKQDIKDPASLEVLKSKLEEINND